MTVNTENQTEKPTIIDDLTEPEEAKPTGPAPDKLAALKAKLQQKETPMAPKIVQKKTRAIKYGVIGSGQGGSRLAEVFHSLGYDTVCINTAAIDLDPINIPTENKLLLEFGLGGASKDPTIGHEAAETHKDSITELVSDKLEDAEVFIFATSLGGGSGSGSIDTVLDVLSEQGRPIVVMTVLPMTNEDSQTKKNSLEALSKLSKQVQNKRIQNLIVVDNAKIESIFAGLSPMDFYDVSNQAIVEPLDAFNKFACMSSPVKAIDQMEWAKLLTDADGLSLYGSVDVTNYQEDTAIAEAVVNNLSSGLLASGFDLKQTKHVAFALVARKSVWDSIPNSSIDYTSAVMEDIAGTPVGKFKGIYVVEDMEDNVVKVYSYFAGLSLPDSRVAELKKEVAKQAEILKTKSVQRNMSLNLDSDSDQNVSAAQKVKDKIASKSSAFSKFTQNVVDRRKK